MERETTRTQAAKWARRSFFKHLAESTVLALFASILLGCGEAENSAVAQNSPANGRSGIGQQDVSTNGNDIREGAGSQLPAEHSNLDERIRVALQSDPAFAADAERIKILVVDGKLVLTGDVRTTVEKQNIEQRVRQMAGNTQIENRLRVEVNGPINQQIEQE